VRYDTAHIDTGWNYHTLYSLAVNFIQSKRQMAEFESYLEEIAEEEEEDDDDD